ncbi:(2Fe-2S)-binding protein [Streptomyces bacillaris]|uniref:(2Fe-2S)-binding protein n=1 Tax=Streptomyces cavourensis TaxID=67258 RepID=A0ABY5F5A6_9ACTN|nr:MULTISPECIES: (2Fe-2S)-binding protein [Streptomyces]ATY98710.1 sarcosine oxidase [Streptomyces cavourensis]MYR37867.1 (2Fe-2S)-binding protein [Streptomyces sp. SID4944]UTR78883.1 (2Fe-2S)-binding protein [Streptomyces cavourensis]WAE69172.1 (2Fe-2S)-binding protein [Streptomyces cavourensis]
MRNRSEPSVDTGGAGCAGGAEGEVEVEGDADVVRFAFDGRALAARPGQSIAGALWGHGIVAWRTTRGGGRPRGAFCGMGVCFDCLVVVNGVPGQRACLVRVSEGDAVTSQEGHGHGALGG